MVFEIEERAGEALRSAEVRVAARWDSRVPAVVFADYSVSSSDLSKVSHVVGRCVAAIFESYRGLGCK